MKVFRRLAWERVTKLASMVKKVFKNQGILGPNRERTSLVNTVGEHCGQKEWQAGSDAERGDPGSVGGLGP